MDDSHVKRQICELYARHDLERGGHWVEVVSETRFYDVYVFFVRSGCMDMDTPEILAWTYFICTHVSR